MKSVMKFFTMLTIVSVIVFTSPSRSSAQQVAVSFQLFYDQLSPYGHWVNYNGNGYAWIPTVSVGFVPYGTGGHWVYTEYGWMWVSDYPWGWAPFHYGRWNFEPAYGWIWVPDNVWGPAWVVWRHAPGYYGWVPMGFHHDNDKDDARWIFVKDKDFDRPDVYRHYVSHTNNVTIIKNSTVVNNMKEENNRHVSYNAGPPKDDVQKVTGKTVRPIAVADNDKPGQQMDNGQIRIYRPQIQNESNDGKKPAPSKVDEMKDVQHAQPADDKNTSKEPAKKQSAKKPKTEKPKEDKPKDKPNQ
ncbi:MAG TPA: DUF6600 domain-containing protein [Cyclobacteriaceae bacterium]|nr:DUF6600 domain-containing protein [Cyclobacteriaceae bacterium]